MCKLITHWLLVVTVVIQPLVATASISGIGAVEEPAVVATEDVVTAQLSDDPMGPDAHPCGHSAEVENLAAALLPCCCENAQSGACLLACSVTPAVVDSRIDGTSVSGGLPVYLPPHVAHIHNIHTSPYRPPRQG